MNRKTFFGDVKRDHMIETGRGRRHDGFVHPGVLDCIRPSKGLSTVRMAKGKRRGPQIAYDRKD